MRPSTARALSLPTLAWALAWGLACGPEAPPRELPGLRLLAAGEARLERERAAFRPMLSHYGLVFPVEPAELAAFMGLVRFHGEGPDLVLGTDLAPEPHGGGLLRLLLDHWRPEGRAARLDDRWAFAANRSALELGRVYAALQQQVFLPVPGLAPEAAGARLPETPQLPRLRLRFALPGEDARFVESDAYNALRVLIDLEPDPSRSWVNRSAQELSVELLMRHVREHYLASRASPAAPADHSNLHLVELLVAFAARSPGRELSAVQRHFLDVELAQHDFAPADAGLVLAHYAESLGHLLEAPGLTWGEEDGRRVRGWLAELEQERFPDVSRADFEQLSHLVKGLRAVRARRSVLEGAPHGG